MKRWLCKDTIHAHSHGHKDTVEDPMYLVNKSFVIQCVADAFRRARADRSALGESESAWGSPSESADEAAWSSFESAHESTWGGDESDSSVYDSS